MGHKVVMDGNAAAAYASYAFTEVVAIYPITPSSQMAECVDEWASQGKKNVFGKPVKVIEMQSEAGAAGTCHGSLQAGALTTTYTAAQGLLLMIPAMFRIAGEFLPGVFHVSARSVAQNMWSIFGDHSDAMTCRSIGFAMLVSASPQEAMDLGAVAHLASIKARHPFMHFFDGFRTSHEVQKIDALDYADLEKLIDYDQIKAFRKNSLNPEHPFSRGTTAGMETFFQGREAMNGHYDEIPDIVAGYMDEINKLTGRAYAPFEYYGASDATECVIAMGSGTETLRDTVDYLNAMGRKVGVISVHLYRPFSAKYFLSVLPETVHKVAVLDRTKESGSVGEPLFLDVTTVLAQSDRKMDAVVGGRFGLSGKDTTPGQMVAVFDNLLQDKAKTNFTIGIEDDVTFTSLPYQEVSITKPGDVSCKLWGTGGDGTVGANKNSVKIAGMLTEKYAQAYFAYDAKKSGGVTQSHLRFSDHPIHATYLVQGADFVAVHNEAYIKKFDTTADLKENGSFLLNCKWSEEELDTHLPEAFKHAIAEKNAKLYILDASKIARDLGLGNRTNTVLQAAFFKLANIIPMDVATSAMKEAIEKTYLIKAGQAVVDLNCQAVDKGASAVHQVTVPESWKLCAEQLKEEVVEHNFLNDIYRPMDKMQGEKIPVSTFIKYGTVDGTWPTGTSRHDKRSDALMVPVWNGAACIQCNQCAMVCPHAAIRPVLLTEQECKDAPACFETIPARGVGDYAYRIQVSPFDCLGCGTCVNACLSKDNALVMQDAQTQAIQAVNWDYGIDTVPVKQDAVNPNTVKGIQFAKPYYEFPPACAGCGETAYVKLLTQLFGSRMYIANASGCTAAHGGSLPVTPYCKDDRGFGPPWEQSLFEDNAEFAYGFLQAHDTVNDELIEAVNTLKTAGIAPDACQAYLDSKDHAAQSRETTDALLEQLQAIGVADGAVKCAVDFVVENKEFLSKKSVWALGGDGWAYDIGFGGLDHVMASGKDINMMVLDTEVYSNTGGQASKATNVGAVAQFAAAGKRTKKKDLGMMLMSYGYIYVAQIAMGADSAQTLKAIREAEAYPGPSVVIAYAPCTAHGIAKGMSSAQIEMKRAVDAGYWHLYRYNPALKAEGKNPFMLDSKEPKNDYLEFIRSERRFASLEAKFPEDAKVLFAQAQQDAKERYEAYLKLSQG